VVVVKLFFEVEVPGDKPTMQSHPHPDETIRAIGHTLEGAIGTLRFFRPPSYKDMTEERRDLPLEWNVLTARCIGVEP
jgi:hypothetical protein